MCCVFVLLMWHFLKVVTNMRVSVKLHKDRKGKTIFSGAVLLSLRHYSKVFSVTDVLLQ